MAKSGPAWGKGSLPRQLVRATVCSRSLLVQSRAKQPIVCTASRGRSALLLLSKGRIQLVHANPEALLVPTCIEKGDRY